MDDDVRIARLERLRHPVCFVGGVVLAVIYVLWQYFYNRWIATYTWMLPFGIGYAIPLFLFSRATVRLEMAKRGELAELPEARVVAAPLPLAPMTVAPERVEPTPAGEAPRLLR